jgi:DNA-binding response OmpR family regulator
MPRRVLIAEEQEECGQLFKQFLQRCGYEVTTVSDGRACEETLKNDRRPDVLILSWELPHGDAREVLRQLVSQKPPVTGVVVLTARMDSDSEDSEQDFPRVTFLQRPFRMLELLDSVQSAERIPRSGWRCMELAGKKSAIFDDDGVTVPSTATANTLRPFNDVLEREIFS